jgi:hypothetical protein
MTREDKQNFCWSSSLGGDRAYMSSMICSIWNQKRTTYMDERARVCGGSASPLLVGDLCAQLISLNRYGPAGLGSAVADGFLALAIALRNAIRHAIRRDVSVDAHA